jgi:hypothetical protein
MYVLAVNIQSPIRFENSKRTGINEKGGELNCSLRPSTLLETDCIRERFEIYFENKLTKAKGTRTGTPAL